MQIMVFSDAAPCSLADEYLFCKQRSQVLTAVLQKVQVLLYVMLVIRQVFLYCIILKDEETAILHDIGEHFTKLHSVTAHSHT
jgi:hypothetical protein